MFKRMTLLRRLPAHDTAQFRAHWAHVHGAMVLGLPGIRRYVQNDIVEGAGRFDGIVELWFDDEPALRAAFASAQGRALPDDEANFLGGKIVCDVEEHVIASGASPEGAAKLITVVHSAHAAERDAWGSWHAGIERSVRRADFECTRMSVHRIVTMQRVGSEAGAKADLFAFVVYHFTAADARASFIASGRANIVERLAFDSSATFLRMPFRERVLKEGIDSAEPP